MTQATQEIRETRSQPTGASHPSTWTLAQRDGADGWFWLDAENKPVRGPFVSEEAGRAWFGFRFQS